MKKLAAVLALAVVLVDAGAARADRRNFAFTYEPRTMAQGEVEAEYYMTAAVQRDRIADENVFRWAHQVELEYGITDYVDVSMYQMFSATGWSGYKLRSRYRPFDTGALPVDMMFYLEFIGHAGGDFSLEEKLVLGRTFGKLVLSLDTTVEQGPLLDGNPSHKLSEAVGLGYAVAPWLTLGLETQARLGWAPRQRYTSPDPVLEFTGASFYTGPTLAFATQKVWWNVHLSHRVAGNDDDARYLFRVLWGVFL